jgi:hypothetical protein
MVEAWALACSKKERKTRRRNNLPTQTRRSPLREAGMRSSNLLVMPEKFIASPQGLSLVEDMLLSELQLSRCDVDAYSKP